MVKKLQFLDRPGQPGIMGIIADLLKREDLPAVAGAKLGRIMRELSPHAEEFSTTWNDYISRFGSEGVISPDHELFAEWATLADELVSEDITLSCSLLKDSDFKDMKAGNLVAALGDLVTEG